MIFSSGDLVWPIPFLKNNTMKETTVEEKLYNDLHYQICNDLGLSQSDSSEFAAKMCVIIAKAFAASLNRPIPIQTPCVELEKEVERLKGLIVEFYWGNIALPKSISPNGLQEFRNKHNL